MSPSAAWSGWYGRGVPVPGTWSEGLQRARRGPHEFRGAKSRRDDGNEHVGSLLSCCGSRAAPATAHPGGRGSQRPMPHRDQTRIGGAGCGPVLDRASGSREAPGYTADANRSAPTEPDLATLACLTRHRCGPRRGEDPARRCRLSVATDLGHRLRVGLGSGLVGPGVSTPADGLGGRHRDRFVLRLVQRAAAVRRTGSRVEIRLGPRIQHRSHRRLQITPPWRPTCPVTVEVALPVAVPVSRR